MDPASLQVLISRLTGIAQEMGAVLQRAAFSPNIKERADCSAALFTAGGELLVQGVVVPRKRPRGRPRKHPLPEPFAPAARADEHAAA